MPMTSAYIHVISPPADTSWARVVNPTMCMSFVEAAKRLGIPYDGEYPEFNLHAAAISVEAVLSPKKFMREYCISRKQARALHDMVYGKRTKT